MEKATTQDFHENGYATMKLERNPKSNLEEFFLVQGSFRHLSPLKTTLLHRDGLITSGPSSPKQSSLGSYLGFLI